MKDVKNIPNSYFKSIHYDPYPIKQASPFCDLIVHSQASLREPIQRNLIVIKEVQCIDIVLLFVETEIICINILFCLHTYMYYNVKFVNPFRLRLPPFSYR